MQKEFSVFLGQTKSRVRPSVRLKRLCEAMTDGTPAKNGSSSPSSPGFQAAPCRRLKWWPTLAPSARAAWPATKRQGCRETRGRSDQTRRRRRRRRRRRIRGKRERASKRKRTTNKRSTEGTKEMKTGEGCASDSLTATGTGVYLGNN